MRASGLKTMIQNRWNRHEVYCKADYWDAKADEYGGTAVSGWPNQSLNVFYDKRELEILHSYLPQIDGAQVLDLGCGTGRIARYLAARNANVLGIDFSAKAIEVAKQQSPSANPAYRVQTIFELKEDKQFDIALSFGCLAVACTNWDTLSTALTNVFNALKPGGRILLLEPIHRGSLHFVLNMNVREFLEVMEEVGFAVKDATALHFWPIVRILGHVNWPRILTVAGYQLGEWMLTLLGGTYFGDYKAILAFRPEE
jgi:2-polyprenyl-3-methyl-5-hydroxy-6-metoxy-1,4-benzoquinol methylase